MPSGPDVDPSPSPFVLSILGDPSDLKIFFSESFGLESDEPSLVRLVESCDELARDLDFPVLAS